MYTIYDINYSVGAGWSTWELDPDCVWPVWPGWSWAQWRGGGRSSEDWLTVAPAWSQTAPPLNSQKKTWSVPPCSEGHRTLRDTRQWPTPAYKRLIQSPYTIQYSMMMLTITVHFRCSPHVCRSLLYCKCWQGSLPVPGSLWTDPQSVVGGVCTGPAGGCWTPYNQAFTRAELKKDKNILLKWPYNSRNYWKITPLIRIQLKRIALVTTCHLQLSVPNLLHKWERFCQ